MNLINNNKFRGNFPGLLRVPGLVKPDFGAELGDKPPFIDLREPQGFSLKVQLPRVKLLIILQMNDISPDKFTTTVFKDIYYSFHMYHLCDDA